MITRIVIGFILFVQLTAEAQISSAKITYERKTNLYKKFKESRDVSSWIKEEDKIKIDFFELFVTDTFSLFRPKETEIREKFFWATSMNTIYQDFHDSTNYMIKTMWGEDLYLTDSLRIRNWKISSSTRKIAGYSCRKAIWQANDSTKIYAWFSYDLTPSTGPETFNGLPGTILGLATEDGGVVYFAKSVEVIKVPSETFIKPRKKKVYTATELKAQLTKEYGHEKWFKNVIYENFGIW